MKFFPFSELLVDDEFIFHYKDGEALHQKASDLFFRKVSANKYVSIFGQCYFYLNSEQIHKTWVTKVLVASV